MCGGNKGCWQAEERARAEHVVEAGRNDEANPWLRRTQWAVYLASNDLNHAADCMQLLGDKDQHHHEHAELRGPPQEPDRIEQTVTVISKAMEAVAFVCQAITKELGHFIRTEAIRVEKQQTRYTPLLAYMNAEAIREHVRPWQQILVFFARTQGRQLHWRCPPYGFTPRQRKTWRILWQRAEARATTLPQGRRRTRGDERGTTPEELRTSQGDMGTSRQAPMEWEAIKDKAIEDANEDADKDASEDASEDPMKPNRRLKLDDVQMACLDFCIELLNQRSQVNEYDCALV